MSTFQPDTVIFRENALEYPLGEKLYAIFSKKNIDTHIVSTRGPFPLEQGLSQQKKFMRAKKTLVIAVRSLTQFQSCKPSAHYQLPLVTGCPGHCQYCYLSTNLGKNPYIKIYVNINEILAKAKKYINKRKKITIFEGAATSDPLPVEKWTNSLAKTIQFFGQEEFGRFRFVTKFTEIEPLLNIEHKKQTEFRFSLNSKYVIENFEANTPKPQERIQAAKKVWQANYPIGFLIAPIFVYDNWQKEYTDLIKKLKDNLQTEGNDLFFELISHRFTKNAKNIIEQVYPKHKLPMNEKNRQFKYGQFGYGKYVYPKETMAELKDFISNTIITYFPKAEIKYFV